MSGGSTVINLKGELVGLHDNGVESGRVRRDGRIRDPQWTGSFGRAIATLKEGKEVEYGLLGILADQQNSNFVSKLTRQLLAAARSA